MVLQSGFVRQKKTKNVWVGIKIRKRQKLSKFFFSFFSVSFLRAVLCWCVTMKKKTKTARKLYDPSKPGVSRSCYFPELNQLNDINKSDVEMWLQQMLFCINIINAATSLSLLTVSNVMKWEKMILVVFFNFPSVDAVRSQLAHVCVCVSEEHHSWTSLNFELKK